MILHFTNICKLISEKIKKLKQKYSEEQIYQDTVAGFKSYDKRCQRCGAVGKLNPYGYYWRHMVYYEEPKIEDKRIKAKRFKCISCGATHALLPDILIPYSPYTLTFKLTVLHAYFKREKTVAKICE